MSMPFIDSTISSLNRRMAYGQLKPLKSSCFIVIVIVFVTQKAKFFCHTESRVFLSHRKQSFLCHTESTYFCHTESTESTEIYYTNRLISSFFLSVISVISVWPFFQHAGWIILSHRKHRKHRNLLFSHTIFFPWFLWFLCDLLSTLRMAILHFHLKVLSSSSYTFLNLCRVQYQPCRFGCIFAPWITTPVTYPRSASCFAAWTSSTTTES